jgi:hypothetical protein
MGPALRPLEGSKGERRFFLMTRASAMSNPILHTPLARLLRFAYTDCLVQAER